MAGINDASAESAEQHSPGWRMRSGRNARGNGLSQAIYFAKNIKAGRNTVTVTFSTPAVYADLRVVEYAGLDQASPFSAGGSATGVGSIATSR